MPGQQIVLKDEPTNAILIGILTPDISRETFNEHIDELIFLLDTAGGKLQKIFTQKIERPDGRHFVGAGRIREISAWVETHKPDVAIFDDELSASQIRNIEKILKCRILDRTNLILDIFARRARTAHAKTQVELAQYEYLLPRLTRMWTHLERQKGGIGLRGPGEKEIETDRRIVRERISLLKEKLKQIDKVKITQRKGRGKLVRVALVGYTNVGKSTIMNLLGKSNVFAEDKLFATLDTTVRKVIIGNLPFLLSDTVGFIRKLPYTLIESFKSTLDEVREADIILHIVDISHPAYLKHKETVEHTLCDIGANEKKTVLIFNKIDKIKNDYDKDAPPSYNKNSLTELQNHWLSNNEHPCIFISAKEKTNFLELKKLLYCEVVKIHTKRYPFDDFLY